MSDIKTTLDWFKVAVPNPTNKSKSTQTAVHIEEFAEMLSALGLDAFAKEVDTVATEMKVGELMTGMVDRMELLDSLCDQIVTAIGIAHMYKLDIVTGMQRVNDSNYSKFVDGKALFDNNGKIKKGPAYHKPDLTGLY